MRPLRALRAALTFPIVLFFHSFADAGARRPCICRANEERGIGGEQNSAKLRNTSAPAPNCAIHEVQSAQMSRRIVSFSAPGMAAADALGGAPAAADGAVLVDRVDG